MNEIIPSVLESSRREARFVCIVWISTCVYTVGYAALFAYRREQPVTTTFGMPSWVFWGVAVPWVLCTVITCVYALCGIRDEDLGEEQSRPIAGSEPMQGEGVVHD